MARPTTDPGSLTAAGFKVLVAEDDTLIAMELEAILKDAGYVVLGPCASAADALAELAAGRPDAALLDIGLADGPAAPVAEGLAAAGVPFVLVTGYNGDRAQHSPFAGAACLAKPFSARDVEISLARLLGGVPA